MAALEQAKGFPNTDYEELAVVIPVFNERETIHSVVCNWTQTLNFLKINYFFFIINDGSTDGSGEILENLKKENKRLDVIHLTNSGFGPSILKGYHAMKNHTWILQIDADEEIGHQEFPQFWNRRHDFDLLIGRRSKRFFPFVRFVVSLCARWSMRILFGTTIYDVNSPYRLMRGKQLEKILSKIPRQSHNPNLLISGEFARRKLRIFEGSVQYRFRRFGKSTYRHFHVLRGICLSFIQIIQFRLSVLANRDHEPLE